MTTLWEDSSDSSEVVPAARALGAQRASCVADNDVEFVGLSDGSDAPSDVDASDVDADGDGDGDGNEDDALENEDEIIIISSDEEYIEPAAAAGSRRARGAAVQALPLDAILAAADADGFPDELLPHFRPVTLVEASFARGTEVATIGFSAQFRGACLPVARIASGPPRPSPKTLSEFEAATLAAERGAPPTKLTGAPRTQWVVTGTKGGVGNGAEKRVLATIKAKSMRVVEGGMERGGTGGGGRKKKRRRGGGPGAAKADAGTIAQARSIVQAAGAGGK